MQPFHNLHDLIMMRSRLAINRPIRNGLCSRALLPMPGFSTIAGCPQIRCLNLSSCVQVNDAILDMITDKCRSLENLNLSSCDALTATGITFLVGYGPSPQKSPSPHRPYSHASASDRCSHQPCRY